MIDKADSVCKGFGNREQAVLSLATIRKYKTGGSLIYLAGWRNAVERRSNRLVSLGVEAITANPGGSVGVDVHVVEGVFG